MAVRETPNHAENPRLTKAASAVGEEWDKVAAAEPGWLARGPHSASSMFFPGCTVASSLLMGIKGLFLIEPLGFIFGFFFPLSDMRNVIYLLPPLVAISYFSLLPTRLDAASLLASSDSHTQHLQIF